MNTKFSQLGPTQYVCREGNFERLDCRVLPDGRLVRKWADGKWRAWAANGPGVEVIDVEEDRGKVNVPHLVPIPEGAIIDRITYLTRVEESLEKQGLHRLSEWADTTTTIPGEPPISVCFFAEGEDLFAISATVHPSADGKVKYSMFAFQDEIHA